MSRQTLSWLAAAVAAATLSFGCPEGAVPSGAGGAEDPVSSGEPGGANDPGSVGAIAESSPGTQAGVEAMGAAPLLPIMVRARQRMNIDQLAAAIVEATGGVGWEGPGGVDAFTALASTLGKPDYLDRTEEDLWPSSLFHKFLDDAARDVCTRLMERELVTAPDERTFLVHVGPEDTLELAEAGVEANLRLLLLRFHGKRLGADAPVLVHWRWLFETVAFATGDPVEAWAAVCIGLITHTDFYSY